MNVFEAVKQSVTTRQAAERYVIKANRNGMCVCPFHNDKNPSSYKLRRYCKHICGVKLFCALHSPQKITLLPLDKRFGNGYTYRAVHFKA